MKNKILVLNAILFLCFAVALPLRAQNDDCRNLKKEIEKCLSVGNCAGAGALYDTYKELCSKDNNIELRIANCNKGNEKPDPTPEPSNKQTITVDGVSMNDNGSGQPGSSNGTWGTQGGTGRGIGTGYSISMGGRGLRGSLPKPSCNYDKDGKVVVEIRVDREGNVIEVMAPARGSTITDKTMIEASKQAARKARFSKDPDASEIQKGTITYIFRTL